jgi:chemotaxis methyl-accepting protein methylase
MVLMISSFPEDQIFKENLTKYFDDEIDHKLIKDFAEKVNARAMQYSKTGMLHLNLIC